MKNLPTTVWWFSLSILSSSARTDPWLRIAMTSQALSFLAVLSSSKAALLHFLRRSSILTSRLRLERCLLWSLWERLKEMKIFVIDTSRCWWQSSMPRRSCDENVWNAARNLELSETRQVHFLLILQTLYPFNLLATLLSYYKNGRSAIAEGDLVCHVVI